MLFETDETLHKTRHDDRFGMTHIGQAHIAGTGPKGTTCRLCKHWGTGQDGNDPGCPGYGSSTKTLNQGRCLYSIPGKARRKFPHYAQSCRFFEHADDPFTITNPENG